MARAADLAWNPRNTAPAVSKVIVNAASDNRDARTPRVVEQIHQRLLDQNLISLSPESAELGRAPPQDVIQLALRGRGEQDIAKPQAACSGLRLTARAPLLRMNARTFWRLDSLVYSPRA